MATTLKQIGEFGLIERISSGCLIRLKNVIRGIGDDAAAVTVAENEALLLTSDLLVEGIHFLRRAVSGFDLGYKALAVNLSDIAAMGGTAREALVSIAIPPDYTIEFIEELYHGMKSLAVQHDVNIIGGDTTGARSDLVIGITVTGQTKNRSLLCRDRARKGDVICLTGYPGESAAGLHLILNKSDEAADTSDYLLKRHRLPRPHLPEGEWLSGIDGVHAAIDLSDGLSSDLGHVTQQSGVGARIDTERLPLSDPLGTYCRNRGLDPLDFMMDGGEDYILLCTVSPENFTDLSRQFEKQFDRPLYWIGEIVKGNSIVLMNARGKVRNITSKGWNHFREE